MHQKIESALGCLLSLCLLLTGCTAPSGEQGIKTSGQSQQTEQLQKNTENQTEESAQEDSTELKNQKKETASTKEETGEKETSAAETAFSEPVQPPQQQADGQDVLSAQAAEPAAQTESKIQETPGLAGTASAKQQEAQQEPAAEEPQQLEPSSDVLSAEVTEPAREEQQAEISAEETEKTDTRLPNPNTGETGGQTKTAAKNVLKPTQPGTESYSDSNTTIDASNSSEGYISVMYSGSNKKVKLRITKSGGTTYTYNISSRGQYEIFPLSAGNGTYSVEVFENVSGNQYAPGLSKKISVQLSNSVGPFLYPNKFVNFNSKSAVVATATSLAQQAADDLDFVTKVYDYTLNTISYDDAKAAVLGSSDYASDVDATCSTGLGVCFDYAAVMAAMLRSQGIPTKLVVGIMNGNIKHAWVSVYISNVGWIHNVIYFDGKSWVRMDPTTADQNNEAYTTNDSNYQTLYVY